MMKTTTPFSRYSVLAGLFSFVAILIVGKLIHVQIFPEREDFERQEYYHSVEWVELTPTRGQIYDRGGYLLAGSKTVYEVGIDLPSAKNPETLALAASTMLDKDYDEIFALVDEWDEETSKIRYYPLADFVPAATAHELANLHDDLMKSETPGFSEDGERHSLYGLILTPHLARTYPEKSLASNMLGFVSLEDIGYYGIEQYYEQMMAGFADAAYVTTVPSRVKEIPEISNGASLVLTIDREIQATMEEILDRAVANTKAEGGLIAVMDPKTGDILAMASAPRIDLSDVSQWGTLVENERPFNLGIHIYEPGSVFKVFTMAAALDSGLVEPDTVFIDPGEIIVGGFPIHNWNGGAFGPQDMTGCLQHSLNVCMAWLSTGMEKETFYDYMQSFGFGHLTGVELAGEEPGRLKLPGDGDWHDADLGTNSYGQGVSVTPVQMLMAVSAVANDGQMMVPRVVQSVVDDGRQFNLSPQVAGTPISKETARTLTSMLATSVESEASTAKVDRYRMAGKTGTASIWIEDMGYVDPLTNASFVGWGPADDPQFIVYVWLQRPQTSIWGSEVAAPVFKEAVERLVVLMDIPPDDVRQAMNGQ